MNLFGWFFIAIFGLLTLLSAVMFLQIFITVKTGKNAPARVIDVKLDVSSRMDSQYVLAVRTLNEEQKEIITRSGFTVSARSQDAKLQQLRDEWMDSDVTVYYLEGGRKPMAYVKELLRKDLLSSGVTCLFSAVLLTLLLLL